MLEKIHAITVDEVIPNAKQISKKMDTIVYSSDEIIDIGNLKNLDKKYNIDVTEKFDNAIIIPGLVNTHTHSVQAFFRGIAENLQLMDWLNRIILPGEGSLKKEEVYASALLGFIDMISNGTTFANDMLTTHHTEAGIQAALDIGIRAKIGKTMMDVGPDYLIDSTQDIIEETFKLKDLFHNKNDLIEYSINPRFLVSCSSELMKFCSKIMEQDNNLSFHTHACENKKEIEIVKGIHGKYIESLYKYGNLGNRSILAHGIWLEPSDVTLLSKTNTSISHCPASNAKLASGICDWPTLQENNIIVGLGTDGPPSNNSMDMFREMRLASFFQRVKTLDETKATSKQVFDLATRQGALALNHSDLGSLKKGMKADFLIIDTSHPSNFPKHDYINHIVFKTSGNDVLRTYIGGSLVYDKNQSTYDKMFPKLAPNIISKSLNISQKYIENKSWMQYQI